MISDEDILNALAQTQHNYTHAAALLKMPRQSLHYRVLTMRARGIKLPYPKRGTPVRKASNGADS